MAAADAMTYGRFRVIVAHIGLMWLCLVKSARSRAVPAIEQSLIGAFKPSSVPFVLSRLGPTYR